MFFAQEPNAPGAWAKKMTTVDHIWAIVETLRPRPDAVLDARPEWECECGGLKMCNDDNIPTCIECGRVDPEFVSDEPEWRGGMDDDGTVTDPSRVGAPVNVDHFSAEWNMGTVMNVRPSAAAPMKRLARINFHLSMNHKDRSLFHAYADMDRVGK